jgi:hypothetical protein
VHYDDMYVTNGKSVRVQRVSTGELKFNMTGHRDVVVTLALDAGAGVLFRYVCASLCCATAILVHSGSADQRIGMWHSVDGSPLGFFVPPQADIVKAG